MRFSGLRCSLVAALLTVFFSAPLVAQVRFKDRPFEAQILRPSGQPVIPTYDGWFENPDGTFTLCYGYFNLNTEESLDIPFGSANRLEPAIYDGVQPTHFDPVPNPELTSRYRHHWCVFTVDVPADFGDRDVVWTLATGSDTLSVPGRLHPLYVVEELESSGRGVLAPGLSFDSEGSMFRGRRGVTAGPLVTRIGEPLSLVAWVEPKPANLRTWLGWTKHQGSGTVTFAAPELIVEAPGIAQTTASFSEPGEYLLRVQVINDPTTPNNPTGSFEFHCCWTNGFVRVTVTE